MVLWEFAYLGWIPKQLGNIACWVHSLAQLIKSVVHVNELNQIGGNVKEYRLHVSVYVETRVILLTCIYLLLS